VFEHIQQLSVDFFNDMRTGELISRITSDVNSIQLLVAAVIEDIVKQPFSLLFLLGALIYTDWKLTLAAAVLLPLCVAPIMFFGRKIRKAARSSQKHQARLASVLHEAIVGSRVVKAFGMEEREARDFAEQSHRVLKQRLRVVVSRAITGPVIEIVASFGAALVFLYAFYSQMPSSELIKIVVGLLLVFEPVKKLSRCHVAIQESLGSADRIFQLLDRQPTVRELPTARQLPRFTKAIRFDNVTFRYDRAAASRNGAVLENINLEVPAGSLVAVVGASGAGKTTLMNLILRFYDATDGAVRIDGVDVRQVTFKSLRDQIGLVTQETFLFNDTVANNIGYGKPGAAADEIVRAAQRAHAHDFIMKMPQGYDTVIGEAGMKISGGQRQRLAIARAILKNPPILLLDEATSALDTETERAIQASLAELAEGRTTLVIAHRLATIRDADRIVVVADGRIAEQGTHADLLARGAAYRALHEAQFGLDAAGAPTR
jgi:subfamily B ATP-binding cassette protein MsbA